MFTWPALNSSNLLDDILSIGELKLRPTGLKVELLSIVDC